MADYKAPVDEMSFVLNDLFNIESLTQIPEFAESTPDLVDAIVEEAAKFSAEVIAPLNRIGDIQHSKAANGEVKTPDGFKGLINCFRKVAGPHSRKIPTMVDKVCHLPCIWRQASFGIVPMWRLRFAQC